MSAFVCFQVTEKYYYQSVSTPARAVVVLVSACEIVKQTCLASFSSQVF
jgi:hypothetical protein